MLFFGIGAFGVVPLDCTCGSHFNCFNWFCFFSCWDKGLCFDEKAAEDINRNIFSQNRWQDTLQMMFYRCRHIINKEFSAHILSQRIVVITLSTINISEMQQCSIVNEILLFVLGSRIPIMIFIKFF